MEIKRTDTQANKDFLIFEMTRKDWEQVQAIYREGMRTGNATFETEIPPWEAWLSGHISGCNLVACRNEIVLGWAVLSPISSRKVYSGVAEVSLYIGEKYRGQNVGSALLQALIDRAENRGFWMLQSGIFPENTASLSLHRKFGFREVGVREKIGKMPGTGRWRDVVILELRSKKIGID